MKRNRKELLVSCGIALLLMLVVPGAFRVWMAFNPPPSKPSDGMPSALDSAFLEVGRAMLLLRKPLETWTVRDRESEPALFAWLGTHAKTILPWEWSASARAKDVSGYVRLWRELLDEQRKILDRSLREIRRRMRDERSAIEVETTLYVHATNETTRLSLLFATNSYPSSVETIRLSKGRFWGWNREKEIHELPNVAAARTLSESIASNGMAHVGRIRDLEKSVAGKTAEEYVHVKLLEEVEASLRQAAEDGSGGSITDEDRLRLLLRLIRFSTTP